MNNYGDYDTVTIIHRLILNYCSTLFIMTTHHEGLTAHVFKPLDI